MRTDTQVYKVLNYMKENGNITALEALNEIGCFRLAARISDLQKLGYHIRHERERVHVRDDSEVIIASYSLLEEEI